MLDTVALSLAPDQFRIRDHDAFRPSSLGLFQPPFYGLRRGSMSCVNNPTGEQTARYGYLPRLTLTKRPATGGFSILLRIEFSAPKLLYGNNFDELTDSDFPATIQRLAEQLERMGVWVSPDVLRDAPVSAIHYSKNLPLTDYTSCSMVIREIAKVSANKRLDSTKTDYRNDGSSIRFHASSHEVIFYDKLKDLAAAKTSDKRAIEDNSALQLPLLAYAFQKPFEVLRIEARLGQRQKLKRLLERLKITAPLTFAGLFSEGIAKRVLCDYWRTVAEDIPILATSGFPAEDLLQALMRQDPDAKPAKLLQAVGALAVINRAGLTGLRAMVESRSDARTWQRLKQGLHDLPLTSNMRYSPLAVAEGHLKAFEALRLRDYSVKQN
jgi:hypothetical protein